MLESKIQTLIKNKLAKDGWLVVKMIQTSLNGWPDLQAHKDGRTVFIEVKQPGKKPTALQQYRHQQLINYGFLVIVAETLKDLEQHEL